MIQCKPFEPVRMLRGPALKNRFVLAPLTNQQSHFDGCLSETEIRWLTKRAAGGFALTMTAAAHVQRVGQGFGGQLGIFGDEHVEGLTRLAAAIRANGSLSAVQLYHAGRRAAHDLVGTRISASDDPEEGARGLELHEVEQLRDDFVSAAMRADRAGFDGVELHGAHGYLIEQFLAAINNRREDRYGGDLENRARLLFEIIEGIRERCRPDFQLGLRLSPERFGVSLDDMRELVSELFRREQIDYLDLSLGDVTRQSAEERFQGRTLLSYFTEMPRGEVLLGAAGKVTGAAEVRNVLDSGCDFVVIGRGAILHHDLPERIGRDREYVSPPLPVTPEHLINEGLSEAFIAYMRQFPGFVTGDAERG